LLAFIFRPPFLSDPAAGVRASSQVAGTPERGHPGHDRTGFSWNYRIESAKLPCARGKVVEIAVGAE
jgi:hypothetical protein